MLSTLITILISVVLPETLHFEDCNQFYYLCTEQGSYPNCMIMELDGCMNYVAEYPYDTFDGDDEDFNKLYAPIFSAAEVSRNTTWNSVYVVIHFSNYSYAIPTAIARELDAMDYLGYPAEERMSLLMAYIQEYYGSTIADLPAIPEFTPIYSTMRNQLEEAIWASDCYLNIRSLALGEVLYHGAYSVYGTTEDLSLSGFMPWATDLVCKACGECYEITLSNAAGSYHIECPSSECHCSVDTDILSESLSFPEEVLSACYESFPEHSPARETVLEVINIFNQRRCRENLSVIATAEEEYYYKYGRYATSNELIDSYILYATLSCPTCHQYYSVIIGNGGEDYSVQCPGAVGHGIIENGDASWN